ncbi:MAG: glycerol-3-phosphate 1-O-acyltransferase PlsY [Candidatus Omnitrophica bacterium]|nr:glycerol-3-phosphate 1-O-acyltransferase PlsY [Candidatus Omnitrophota bacterium]
MNIFLVLLGIVVAYLLGTVSSAYILVKMLKGEDIRECGSGNTGATNAARVLGKLPGLLVLGFDILKGVIAVVFIANFIDQRVEIFLPIIKTLLGLAVVCGHVFNVFLQFKGGKGVATSAGVLLCLSPVAVLMGMLVFLLVVGITQYVSLGSIVCSILIPFFMLGLKAPYAYVILASILCVIIVAKHKANINRLLTGRERKVFVKK